MIEVIGVISGKLGCHDYTECVVCEGGNGHGFAARLEFCKKDSPSFLGSHEAYCSLCTEPDEHKGGKQLRLLLAELLSSLPDLLTGPIKDGTAEEPGAFTVGLLSCFTIAAALEVITGNEGTETTPLPLFFFTPEELG
nr:hypothetical protein Iba_chr12dCG11140 [Ipomoea batatas]